MVDESLRKDLIAHYIYTSWQFIKYTEKNISTVNYCFKIINKMIDELAEQTTRWEHDILDDFTDEIDANGKKIKRLTVSSENFPVYEVKVVGENVNPWFLFDKLLRDFFQYSMNTFDSISQIINAGLLANKSKKVDSVDFQRMKECFNQQTYSTKFPKMKSWLNKMSNSQEYEYIEAINNRTKHTADISNKLSMGIFGSKNKTEIGSFFRKDIQHEKKELTRQLQISLKFLNRSWREFLHIFKEEYEKDTFSQNRTHTISGVYQQKLIDDPKQNLSYAYITADCDFDSMPDELYILLVQECGNKIYAHECPFETILITGTKNTDILGRYYTQDKIEEDCLLHYKKYIKDYTDKGVGCLFNIYKEDTIFYSPNPFFEVTMV